MKLFNNFLAILLSVFLTIPANAQFTSVAEQSTDKNYISNGGFENSKTGWAAYKNTAQAMPVTGTGGAPTATITSSTSSPIAGKSSGILTKTAANLQGEGISYAFAVDSAAKGRVLTISGLYQIISGTYSGGTSTTDSDVEAYIYDVDAGVIIQPAGYKLDGGVSGLNYTLAATFQTNTTSTNYRLILNIATVSASAYSLKLDSIKIGVGNKSQGPPITDWQSYTPTGNWSTATSTYTGKWRRIGDSIEITAQVAISGAVTAAPFNLNIPSGMAMDTTKFAGIGNTGSIVLGQGGSLRSSISNQQLAVIFNSTTAITLATLNTAGTYGIDNGVTNSVPVTWAAGDIIYATFRAPILGWASTTTMSDSSDSRVVAATAFKSTLQTIATLSPTEITGYDSATIDTHGNFNSTTGRYTVTVPGLYRVTAFLTFSINSTGYRFTQVNKNGGLYAYGNTAYAINGDSTNVTASALVKCVAGDYISQSGYQNSGGNLDIRPLGNTTQLIVERVTGPSQIAASESVNARYTTASGQSIAAGSQVTLLYDNKVYDTHGIYNSANGKLTAPVSGRYRITAKAMIATATMSTTGGLELGVMKNGSYTAELGRIYGNGSATNYTSWGSTTVDLLAGETANVFLWSPVATTIFNSAFYNYIEIEKLK